VRSALYSYHSAHHGKGKEGGEAIDGGGGDIPLRTGRSENEQNSIEHGFPGLQDLGFHGPWRRARGFSANLPLKSS
jgi:hypothetical protein